MNRKHKPNKKSKLNKINKKNNKKINGDYIKEWKYLIKQWERENHVK